MAFNYNNQQRLQNITIIGDINRYRDYKLASHFVQ